MPQRIIDLDAALPAGITVRCDGKEYELPGDIPVPDYLEIARLSEKLTSGDEASAEALEDLYERVLDLFRVKTPDLEELPIGPQRLGSLIVQLYTAAAEGDGAAEPDRPTKRSTRSTSRKKTTRSRSSR